MTQYNNLFLLRHMETQNNKSGIITGQGVVEIIYGNVPKVLFDEYDKIYCSTSLRCIQTVRHLANNEYITKRIIFDERLLERDMGRLTGMRREKAVEMYPDIFLNKKFNVFANPPDGESFEQFKKRISDFFIEKVKENADKKILICSHNQTLKMLRLIALDEVINNKSWSSFSFVNGQVVRCIKK